LVIHASVLDAGIIPKSVHLYGNQAFVLCALQYGMGKGAIKQAWKDGNDVYPHDLLHFRDRHIGVVADIPGPFPAKGFLYNGNTLQQFGGAKRNARAESRRSEE